MLLAVQGVPGEEHDGLLAEYRVQRCQVSLGIWIRLLMSLVVLHLAYHILHLVSDIARAAFPSSSALPCQGVQALHGC